MSERLTHYVNGTVVTVDDEFTIAGAFPVRGNRFAQTGAGILQCPVDGIAAAAVLSTVLDGEVVHTR
jgi:hypothetical protein